MHRFAVFALGWAVGLSLPLSAQLIELHFDNDADGSLSAGERAIFQSAADTWNGIITGYAPGITKTTLTIDAHDEFSDGVGGILATAGPNQAVSWGGYIITHFNNPGPGDYDGFMEFDSADVDVMFADGVGWENALFQTVLHEMAHVLGFGTLWEFNNVYDASGAPGQYTGAAGLATYQAEFNQPAAAFVPVELQGGAGTAHGHWNEEFTPPSGPHPPNGITDAFGRDLGDDILTGWTGPGSTSQQWLSETSAYSLEDIGFLIAYSAMPEPSLPALLALAAFSLALNRKR
ncbi:MAG: hypothetical protein HKN82_12150 [Akkermansiaceae bacterium]|nr:hypothetical protein [Akkermansiaceae bacterium]